MDIREILDYLFRREVNAVPVNTGASGAKLWRIDTGGRTYVLKHAHPSFHSDPGLIEGYRKEFEFYKLNESLKLPFLPGIVHAELHDDYGILLVMDCCEPIPHERWDLPLQKQAADLCARLNSLPADVLAPMNLHFNRTQIDPDFTAKAYEDWKFVLGQHKGRFDEALLDEIYENIGIVCPILNAEPYSVCHGDFHPDNLLLSADGLRLCDWQNVGVGKCSGDISFFIGRGLGFGIDMNADELLDYYCAKLSEYSGAQVEKTTILKEKYASTLLVTLSFWANYLKDCPAERVAVQFDDMAEAYRYLMEH